VTTEAPTGEDAEPEVVEPAVVTTEAPTVEDAEPEVVEPEVVTTEAPTVEDVEPEVVEITTPDLESVESTAAETVSTEEVVRREETEGPAEA
jgi:hypothetical protein